MGIIIAKFRKKKSTYEVLEKLEQEIIDIEEFSRTTENTKKKIVGRFIIIAFSTYLFLALGLYFYYHRISPYQKLIYTSPLIVVPIVTYVIKSFLTWYYSRKIRKNQSKLVKLKEEKKKILEKVEETETYKVAKQILDKFGETSKKPSIALTQSTPSITAKTTGNVPTAAKPIIPGLRQRTVGPPAVKGRLSFGNQDANPPTPSLHSGMGRGATPGGKTTGLPISGISGYSATPIVAQNVPSTSSALQLPRAILPQKRTVLDKMFDYLVGDGPSNRYALICKNCFNHNGMAFKEEFEYLSFKCCYCGFFNPSRKKRPSGPKFEPKISPSRTLTAHSSDSEMSSVESEESSKPLITEVTNDSPDTTDKTVDFGTQPVAGVQDTVGSASPEESHSSNNETRSPGTSQDEIQDSGDSQPVQMIDKNLYEANLNPFEDRNPSGDGRNPFGDEENETELQSSPMDFETIDGSESVPQDDDLIKTHETNED